MALDGIDGGSNWTIDDDKKWDKLTAHNQDRLNSTEIDKGYPYTKQVETVRQALKEAFGEYAKDIQLVNAFFLELEFFMDQMKAVQDYKGSKESAEYQSVIENGLSGGNAIIFSIIDHWKTVIKKMEAELAQQGKSADEVQKIVKWKFDKFLSLLREKIKYES